MGFSKVQITNMDKVVRAIKKMDVVAETEGKKFVNDNLNKQLGIVQALTPVDTGNLRRGWKIRNAQVLRGRIVGALINTEPYSGYVNDGHRDRSHKKFIKGQFMLERSTNYVKKSYTPKRFKQMAVAIAKKG